MRRQLQAFHVRDVWDKILPGLLEVKKRAKPSWRPEDLYAACLNGQLYVFMPDEDSSDFVLLGEGVSAYTGKRILKIVVAYSKDGNAIKKYGDQIDEIGIEAGCVESEFSSSRKGWQRLGPKYGYEPEFVVYRRKLTHGQA